MRTHAVRLRRKWSWVGMATEEGHHHHNRDYSEKENGAKDHHGRVSLLSQECACLIPDTSACPLRLVVMLLMAYFLYSLNDNMA